MKTIKVKLVQNLKSLGIRVWEDKEGKEYFEDYRGPEKLGKNGGNKIFDRMPDDLDANELKVDLIHLDEYQDFY